MTGNMIVLIYMKVILKNCNENLDFSGIVTQNFQKMTKYEQRECCRFWLEKKLLKFNRTKCSCSFFILFYYSFNSCPCE